jgi:site-specific DNA-methyltransferase (adenine-specific)
MSMGGTTSYADRGGPSRFFYVAKPSRSERDYGCDALPARTAVEAVERDPDSPGARNPRAGAGRTATEKTGIKNHHPTVKPVTLMRYLIRLIVPPGGTVIDPFMGSGTTGVAAVLEGRSFIGVEREAEFIEIARHRIAQTLKDTEANESRGVNHATDQ